jgi:hypothetical protein
VEGRNRTKNQLTRRTKKLNKLGQVRQTLWAGSCKWDSLIEGKIRKNLKLNSQNNQMLKDKKKNSILKYNLKKDTSEHPRSKSWDRDDPTKNKSKENDES